MSKDKRPMARYLQQKQQEQQILKDIGPQSPEVIKKLRTFFFNPPKETIEPTEPSNPVAANS